MFSDITPDNHLDIPSEVSPLLFYEISSRNFAYYSFRNFSRSSFRDYLWVSFNTFSWNPFDIPTWIPFGILSYVYPGIYSGILVGLLQYSLKKSSGDSFKDGPRIIYWIILQIPSGISIGIPSGLFHVCVQNFLLEVGPE